ncbi:unnamed protein product [Linum trigynum]|uniref:Uncharacterized protein n=1 Tax=Linum trigynum TaxID=586398 RepID=A0AAV2FH37_9ROSI
MEKQTTFPHRSILVTYYSAPLPLPRFHSWFRYFLSLNVMFAGVRETHHRSSIVPGAPNENWLATGMGSHRFPREREIQ